jgi:hypothetical protein
MQMDSRRVLGSERARVTLLSLPVCLVFPHIVHSSLSDQANANRPNPRPSQRHRCLICPSIDEQPPSRRPPRSSFPGDPFLESQELTATLSRASSSSRESHQTIHRIRTAAPDRRASPGSHHIRRKYHSPASARDLGSRSSEKGPRARLPFNRRSRTSTPEQLSRIDRGGRTCAFHASRHRD